MAPNCSLRGNCSPIFDSRCISFCSSSRTVRSSETSVTIGSMMRSSWPAEARSMRAQLRAQQARPVERQADRPPAERRVFFFRRAEIGHDLVAADIERAEGHRLAGRLLHDVAIEGFLLLHLRHGRGDHELQLGAEQADALGAGFGQLRQVDQQAGIHLQA